MLTRSRYDDGYVIIVTEIPRFDQGKCWRPLVCGNGGGNRRDRERPLST